MSRRAVDCVLCGAPHPFRVIRGAGPTHDSPSDPDEIDFGTSGCACADHPVVDTLNYWDEMVRAAEEALQEAGR